MLLTGRVPVTRQWRLGNIIF